MRIVVNKKVGTGLKKDSGSGCDRQVSVNDTLPRKLFELCPKKDDVNILNLKDLFLVLISIYLVDVFQVRVLTQVYEKHQVL